MVVLISAQTVWEQGRLLVTEYRVWLKSTEGIYPVQTNLHYLGKAPTPICQHCSSRENGTLNHFTSVCHKFREARKSTHNQVRQVISTFSAHHDNIGHRWRMFDERSQRAQVSSHLSHLRSPCSETNHRRPESRAGPSEMATRRDLRLE